MGATRKTEVPSQVSPPRRERGILAVIFLKVLILSLIDKETEYLTNKTLAATTNKK
jgi:hypothetical protein